MGERKPDMRRVKNSSVLHSNANTEPGPSLYETSHSCGLQYTLLPSPCLGLKGIKEGCSPSIPSFTVPAHVISLAPNSCVDPVHVPIQKDMQLLHVFPMRN